MLFQIWRWFMGCFQECCQHEPCNVTADLNEGAFRTSQLQWCRVCGAVRTVGIHDDGEHLFGEWKVPNSEWQAIVTPTRKGGEL